MKRRDLLKLIGIGGVGAVASVVGGKEVEAAPVEPPKPVAAQGTPVLPGWGYIGSPGVASGTVSYWMGSAVTSPSQHYSGGTLQAIPGKGFVSHREWADWYEAWKKSGDPYPESSNDAWWGGDK